MGVPVKKTSGKKKPARAPQQMTAEEHFENAEMAFVLENFEQARTSFKQALEMEPENMEFLEGYGSFLAEVGDHEEAVEVLRKAVGLQPEEGFEKYMYLGQLVEGEEGEQAVRKGLSILRGHIKEHSEQPKPEEGSEEAEEAEAIKAHLDHTLSSCLCTLVEVLVNNAHETEPGVASVEAECEQLLGEARTLAPENPEPLQALASLRQQQDKPEEALALLKQSVALWFKPSEDESEEEEGEEGKGEEGGDKAANGAEAAAADDKEEELGSDDEDDEDDDDDYEMMDDEDDDLPSYEFRFETAKLLLELDDSVELASQILEQLLEENDEDPNVWMLLALCYQSGGDLQSALEAAEEGLSVCKKHELPADDAQLQSFELMQTELKKLIESEEKEEGAAADA